MTSISEAPENRSADPNHIGSKSKGLEDIRASPNPAIKPDFYLFLRCEALFILPHYFDYLRENFDGSWGSVQLPGPVVANIDAIGPVLESQEGVLHTHDALRKHWHLSLFLDEPNDLPGELIVFVVPHEVS